MLALIAAMLVQAASGDVAPSKSDDAPPKVVTRPDWIRRPSAEDMARNMPAHAAQWAVAGKTGMDYSVASTGVLVDCRVTSEIPSDFGFGNAALRLSKLFKMRPSDGNGVSVEGGHIHIPILFLLPRNGALKPVIGTSAKFAGAKVEVDCRLIGSKLDNCFTVKAQPYDPELASEAANALGGNGVTPDVRPDGRVIVPVEFRAP